MLNPAINENEKQICDLIIKDIAVPASGMVTIAKSSSRTLLLMTMYRRDNNRCYRLGTRRGDSGGTSNVAVLHLQDMIRFTIVNCGLTDGGATAIGAAIAGNNTLVELNLSQVRPQHVNADRTALRMWEWLASQMGLERTAASKSIIGDVANSHSLYLENNAIENAGAIALSEALLRPTGVEEICKADGYRFGRH